MATDSETTVAGTGCRRPTKIVWEMYRRHAKSRLLEDEQAMGHGIEIGRDGFWIELNEEKYQMLRKA